MPEYEEDKYEQKRRIGEGAFGAVFEVEETATGNCFAMKKIELDPTGQKNKYVQREVKHMLTPSKHENIVLLHDIFRAPANRLIFVMELCDCDLADFMWDKSNRTDEIKLNMLLQCARGLHFLHSCSPPIIHRDVKPNNILIKQNNDKVVIKIADFGISSEIDEQTFEDVAACQSKLALMKTDGGGTKWFMAPEFFKAKEQNKSFYVFPSVDIFALGLVFAFVVDWNENNDYGECD